MASATYLIFRENDDLTQVDDRGTTELLRSDGRPSATLAVLVVFLLQSNIM